jgi:hypothetical protein
METDQKNEQVANSKSNQLNEDRQDDNAIQKGNDNAAKNNSSSDDDEPSSTEKERKSNEHEHSYKTPVAKPDGEKENKSEKTEQDTSKNQSSK